jgi:hypothetical protein
MVLTVAVASACATGGGAKSATTVSDADLANLNATQMASVNQARQGVLTASDELGRAQARLREAQHEEQFASADQTTAKASMEQAKTMQQVAGERHNDAKAEQARGMFERAGAQQRAADARSDYAAKLVAANQASVQAATDKKEVADARLEVAKLQALRRSNVPVSGNYDMAVMEKRVQDAEAKHLTSQQKAQDLSWWAQQAHRTFGDAQRELHAGTGPASAPATGTGSSAPATGTGSGSR